MPLIFIAEEPAETPQCEHVGVCVGKADRPCNDHTPQHLCPRAGLKKKKGNPKSRTHWAVYDDIGKIITLKKDQLGKEGSRHLLQVLSSVCCMFKFSPLLWQNSFKVNGCTG